MQTTNEIRRQASTAGFLITAILLLSAAANAQSSGDRPEKETEQTTRRIIVSIPDRKLALLQDGEVKKVFPVAIGKDSTPSPSGSFRIVNRVTKPTYYHAGKVIAAGPLNPLGTRWMGLSEHGYGIHGTNAPSSIGKAASHGCVRMARADLEQLFELVKVGDAVEIRAERDEETARLFGTANTLLAEAGNEPPTNGE
jgi:lipoprotein-anchoring transpeptidase ErfK/SrfK